jgi:hypothetical protein
VVSTPATNYDTPRFLKTNAPTDPYSDQELQYLEEAVDGHDHSAGRGLAVARLGAGVISQSAIGNDAVGFDQLSDSPSTDSLRAVGTNHIRTGAVTARTIGDHEVSAIKLGVGASAGLTFPRVYAGYTLNSQTILNAQATSVIFSGPEIYDNATMHSPTVTPTRITITTSGWYLFFGYVKWAAAATGSREVYFVLSRSGFPRSYLQGAQAGPANTGLPILQSMAAPFELLAGDYVELDVYQTSLSGLVLADAGFGATAFGG